MCQCACMCMCVCTCILVCYFPVFNWQILVLLNSLDGFVFRCCVLVSWLCCCWCLPPTPHCLPLLPLVVFSAPALMVSSLSQPYTAMGLTTCQMASRSIQHVSWWTKIQSEHRKQYAKSWSPIRCTSWSLATRKTVTYRQWLCHLHVVSIRSLSSAYRPGRVLFLIRSVSNGNKRNFGKSVGMWALLIYPVCRWTYISSLYNITLLFHFIPMFSTTLHSSISASSFQNVHSSFMRTVPPYSSQAEVWVALVKYFGFKRVIFIHSSDQEGRAVLGKFQSRSETEDIEVSIFASLF